MLEFDRIRWALRKASLPISGSALVLDVGSGGKPHVRADVLLDRPVGAEHRCGQPMIVDRPTVFGDAERLPFKDKAFDFVIAAHILEHMERPEIFLSELQRVSHAGYIETPNFLFERMIPYEIHCLEVAVVDGILHIRKKSKAADDEFIRALDFLRKDKAWKRLFYTRPSLFHVCHYWTESIQYKIYNSSESTEWIRQVYNDSISDKVVSSYVGSGWRGIGQAALNRVQQLRRSRRLSDFDLRSILACPICKGELQIEKLFLLCKSCDVRYRAVPSIDFTEPIIK